MFRGLDCAVTTRIALRNVKWRVQSRLHTQVHVWEVKVVGRSGTSLRNVGRCFGDGSPTSVVARASLRSTLARWSVRQCFAVGIRSKSQLSTGKPKQKRNL